MSGAQLKRPIGLTPIALLWFFYGVVNVYFSCRGIIADIAVLPYLSNPSIPEWSKLGVPAELALSVLRLCLGLLQIVAFPGLWTGKRYSYKLALPVAILLVINSLAITGLYLSAPAELELRYYIGFSLLFLAIDAAWAIVYWRYRRKQDVKAFFGVTQPEPAFQKLQSSIPEKLIAPKEKLSDTKPKFYCRHCGAENKVGALFCKKCGMVMEQNNASQK